MSTKTYKRGEVVTIDGQRYTLTDRRPGVGGWWAEGPEGVVAVKATPKLGASVDFEATRRTRELQKMTASISKSKVYEYTLFQGEVLQHMVHQDETCSRIEELDQRPSTGATALTAAYQFLQAETGKASGTTIRICPCALEWKPEQQS